MTFDEVRRRRARMRELISELEAQSGLAQFLNDPAAIETAEADLQDARRRLEQFEAEFTAARFEN